MTPTIAEKRAPWRDLNPKAIQEFIWRLREAEGENLLLVLLFGSVARGDDNEDSDIDLFIVLEEYDCTETKQSEIKERIYNIMTDVETIYRHRVCISPFICSAEYYQENHRRAMIFYNIADEGVLLYDKYA